MRSIRRRYRVLGTVLAITLAASACSSGDDDPQAAPTDESEDDGGTSTESSDPPASEPPTSGSGETVKVAFLAPLTSGNSAFAQDMENSATLAVDEYNASGGECQMALDSYDNRGTPEDSTRVAQRALSSEGAQVLVGTYASAEALAVKELAERQETVFISVTGISPGITEDAKYTFRTSVTTNDYPVAMAALMQDLGITAPTLTHDDGPVGGALSGPIADAIRSEGIEFAGDLIGYPLNAPDLSTTIQQAASQNPDALLQIGSSAADSGLVVKTVSDQGLDVPVIGFSSLAAPDALEIGGSAYDEIDVYTFFNRDPNKPEYQSFLDLYTAEFGENENLAEQAPQVYDAIRVLGAALDATGCDATGSVLAEALHGAPPQEAASGPTGQTISFEGTQDGFGGVVMTPFRLEDGAQVPVE